MATKTSLAPLSKKAAKEQRARVAALKEARHEEAVESALKELNPREREVLQLLYFGDKTHEEAAEVTALQTNSVRGLEKRALMELESILDAEGVALGGHESSVPNSEDEVKKVLMKLAR